MSKPASRKAGVAKAAARDKPVVDAPRVPAPAVSMRDQVQAFKREQILKVTAELFYEIGYQRTTLDRVAERLGVTKPFIYYHYKDKAELLFEISKRGITDGNEILRRALAADGTTTERLSEAVKAIVRTIVAAQRYTAIFFREQKNFDAEIRAPLETMHREFDDLLAQLLQEGVDKGEFQIDDVRLCSLAIGGMINWAYTWYRENGRLSIDALCDGMAGLALKAVGAS
ncbi:TetR/AcrR family transcriptional regulator [Nevskia ramosa]|uniref:TetR/AcrR family transcriptional regulator n=1 Tax=Nevskia ramosa TaxID=64002 RepID=UPI001469BE91|nr:TetR/AcrR family transcriptional regulator [Nevskia ramosa]